MNSLMMATVFERAAAHVDVRRIMVEGIYVNHDALNDEYRTHDAVVYIVLTVQI